MSYESYAASNQIRIKFESTFFNRINYESDPPVGSDRLVLYDMDITHVLHSDEIFRIPIANLNAYPNNGIYTYMNGVDLEPELAQISIDLDILINYDST